MNRYALLFIVLVVTISATQEYLQLTRFENPDSPKNFLGSRAPSIGLSLSASSVTVVVGSAAHIEVHISLGASRPFRVGLTAQRVPAGVTVSLSPPSAKPPFSCTIMIVASELSVPGRYNLTIVASGGGLASDALLSIFIVRIVHDLAVIRAYAPATATTGSLVLVNTTIANYGSLPETFNVNLYSNGTLVDSGHRSTLTAGAQQEITLAWNTTGFAAGKYNLVVSVPSISGESDLTDNTLNAGTVTVEESPSGNPNPPTPVSSNPGTGLIYGRALAIAAAIGEILLVALVFFQRPITKTVRRLRRSVAQLG